MNTKINMHFNNTYYLELIDASSGEVKQKGTFHNIVTKDFMACFVGRTRGSSEGSASNQRRSIGFLAVGKGTNPPTKDDTSLGSQLWSQRITPSTSDFEWLDEYTGKCTYTVTFPATSSYVGTVTEVGILGFYAGSSSVSATTLHTHALLTDSEGQLISFAKTDTDILKVSVSIELSLSSIDEHFKVFKYPFIVADMLLIISASNSDFTNAIGKLNLCRFHYDIENFELYRNKVNSSRKIEQEVNAGVLSSYTDECYLRFPVTRLGTDTITAERYFKGVAIPGIGYWKLPNESIFPAYSIVDIEVGVGDGTRTDFDNPLCYFKEGTDKIYKNGVQLTRGVDYTISNVGNAKCLPEVAELVVPSSITSGDTSISTVAWYPMFLPSSAQNAGAINTGNIARLFSSTNPLFIEYDEPVTFNCLKSTGGFYKRYGDNSADGLSSGTSFYLDYSTDGVIYTELGSYKTVTSGSSGSAFNIDFEDTTAKYWRLRTSSTTPIGMYAQGEQIMLNRKDPYIKFAVAPAEGDVITMDVMMDVIMKNSNFVLDVGCRIDFSEV